MNERIKKLRKALDLTQQEFSNRIGIKRNTLANYEIGRNEPIDAVINLICREFNVSETWLRTGEGEMFNAKPSAALDALAMERDLSCADYLLIEKFLNLKEESRRTIIDYMMEVSSALSQMDADDIYSAATPDMLSAKPLTPEEIDRRSAEYRAGLEMDASLQRRRSLAADASRPEDDPEIMAQMKAYGQALLNEKKRGKSTSAANE